MEMVNGTAYTVRPPRRTGIEQSVNTKGNSLTPPSTLVDFFHYQDILMRGLAKLTALNVSCRRAVVAFCDCADFCAEKVRLSLFSSAPLVTSHSEHYFFAIGK